MAPSAATDIDADQPDARLPYRFAGKARLTRGTAPHQCSGGTEKGADIDPTGVAMSTAAVAWKAAARRHAVLDALPGERAEQVQSLKIDEGDARRGGTPADCPITIGGARHGVMPAVRHGRYASPGLDLGQSYHASPAYQL